MYQAVVTFPVACVEGTMEWSHRLDDLRRFVPFVWMSASTMLVTGTIMLLFSPRFIFLGYQDAWSVAMGLKELIFLMMVFFSFGYGRMLAYGLRVAPDAAGMSEERSRAFVRMQQFHRINTALAILAILLAASLS